uniref:Zinc finger protein 333 n=1 Tax=Sciurus vulgaris TaxID=55149 RepID=A0A8D2E361_SCIVU
MGLMQEQALLDEVRKDLCRHVILDDCQTLTCRGKASSSLFLLHMCQILPKCLPWGQADVCRCKESASLQGTLEDISLSDMQMVRFLGLSLAPYCRKVEESVNWKTSIRTRETFGAGESPQRGAGLKVALQIQRVVTPVPTLGLPIPWVARASALPAQDPAWLQEEEEATAPGLLTTCSQVSVKSLLQKITSVLENSLRPSTGDQLCKPSTLSHWEQREELWSTGRGVFPETCLGPHLRPQESIPSQDIFVGIPSIGTKQERPQPGEKHREYEEPLLQYQTAAAGEAPYPQQESRQAFLQSTHLISPGKVRGVAKTYACSQCEKSFRYSSDLLRHEKTHTAEKFFECQECGQAFKYSSNLRRHLRTHTGEKPFECGQCGKTFTRNFNLILHQRNHTGEKPYACKDCGKAFNQPSSLRSHVRTHTGEKPFECSQCGKAFREHSSLKTHLRTHTREKPYACSQCGKPFRTSTHLNVHKRIHTGEKLYECGTCGQVLSRLSTLKSHMRTHTGEKPYACQECGRAFSEPSSLRKHARTHTGKKPYACQECGRAFGQSSHLIVHVRTHSSGRPYPCNQCEKAFRHSSSLAVHRRTHTGRESVRNGGLPPSGPHLCGELHL